MVPEIPSQQEQETTPERLTDSAKPQEAASSAQAALSF